MLQVARWLLPEVTADAIEAAAGLGLSGIYPNAKEVTADDMKLTKDAGLSVRTWGYIGNSRQALERAYRSGTGDDYRLAYPGQGLSERPLIQYLFSKAWPCRLVARDSPRPTLSMERAINLLSSCRSKVLMLEYFE